MKSNGAAYVGAASVYTTSSAAVSVHSLAVREVSVPRSIVYSVGVKSLTTVYALAVSSAVRGKKENWKAGELGAT